MAPILNIRPYIETQCLSKERQHTYSRELHKQEARLQPSLTIYGHYRKPILKCVVKRLRLRVFKEIANSIIAFWARPHVHNTLIAF